MWVRTLEGSTHTSSNQGTTCTRSETFWGTLDDHKTASKFQGPYVILEKGMHKRRVQISNFYIGKIMKNFVHVDKLCSYQGARAAKGNPQTVTNVNVEKRTAGSPWRRQRSGYRVMRPRFGPTDLYGSSPLHGPINSHRWRPMPRVDDRMRGGGIRRRSS